MKTLPELLREPGHFPTLRAIAPKTPWQRVGGLDGSAPAVAVALSHRARGERAATLVLCEDARQMELLRDDLGALLGDDEVLGFPGLEMRPYEWRHPFGHALEQRLSTLHALRQAGSHLVVATLSAFCQKLSSPEKLEKDILKLAKGDLLDLPRLRLRLARMGFREEAQCEELGTFSVRGGIVDLFPYALDNPVRLELFGEEIESMRSFDLFTQKSLGAVDRVEILPMDEGLPDEASLQDGLMRILEALPGEDAAFERERRRLEEVSDYIGWTWQRPWFVPTESTLLDHLGQDASVFLMGGSPESVSRDMLDKAGPACAQAQSKGFVVAAPEELWLRPSEFRQILSNSSGVSFHAFRGEENLDLAVECQVQERSGKGIGDVAERVKQLRSKGTAVQLLSANHGQASRLTELIEGIPVAGIVVGHLSCGFLLPSDGLAWWTDHQIFNRFARRVRARKARGGAAIPDFDALTKGDFVVHETHGIAKYLGIERIKAGSDEIDCIVLQYEGKDRLRLPVSDLWRIQKYGSAEGAEPGLHKLGGRQWDALKEKTKKAVDEMVRELVELYARRSVADRVPYPPDDHFQKEFEDSFDWDLTPDQDRAVREAKLDLEGLRPMDRLVCGDVGFGKTEVAVRAIFKAVMGRRQVALLCPTTLLSSQHFATLSSRFADWPIRVELLNRFVSAKEQKATLADIKSGKVDVVVGTHRILAKDLDFADLGLLVLDEEQKFGVKQKEKLKELRAGLDVLSLSATPIPRSLHMSLSGVREISIIATPPRNRLPVDTRVSEVSDRILTDSVSDELARGGQVFIVHPHIKGLEEAAARIEELVPSARVCVAHGQMDEDDLEQVMSAFLNREFDVLVSTTIVESGLDIPSVNTILVLEAHRFGLSQLHQLRGRVGRSDVKGFCWLLVPDLDRLLPDAKKRLSALEQFTDLGSGYAIAMRDLEIRGAGNLLSHKQSGFVAAVGFETYCRILKEAVEELGGEKPRAPLDPRIEFPADAFLPESYIEDPALRIQLYQRIARAKELSEIDGMGVEFRDRFGPLPEPVRAVLRGMAARLAARTAGISLVGITRGRAILEFDEAWRPELAVLKERVNGAKPRIEWLAQPLPLRMVADLTGYPVERQQDECLMLVRLLAGESSKP
jgi:transcription-repair coupling factor (superfamily II helicase)